MTSSAKPKPPPADRLVPEPDVLFEFGISAMCAWRWDRDERMIEQGWPVPIKINRRKFRSRAALDAFKQNLVERAVKDRAVLTRQVRRDATSGDTEATADAFECCCPVCTSQDQ
jgi:hypothetical protein